MKFGRLLILAILLALAGCGGEDTQPIADVDPGNDPNFTIVSHNDVGFIETNRKVVVFGIPIYAYAEVEDAKLLHAANIMVQYLDNDEDGVVDNQRLLDAMISTHARLFMWKTEDQINLDAQDLGADETVPVWHTNGHSGEFDVALEEIWHVITVNGYANAYPAIFGEEPGTGLTSALDAARGGQFMTVPKDYPVGAWFTYDDETCDYNCMASEYFYWAMTSILGAQENRGGDISQEWALYTKSLVQANDVEIYSLLTDTQYKFPTVLPDGTYRR